MILQSFAITHLTEEDARLAYKELLVVFGKFTRFDFPILWQNFMDLKTIIAALDKAKREKK